MVLCDIKIFMQDVSTIHRPQNTQIHVQNDISYLISFIIISNDGFWVPN
jgi:hypothetical protein